METVSLSWPLWIFFVILYLYTKEYAENLYFHSAKTIYFLMKNPRKIHKKILNYSLECLRKKRAPIMMSSCLVFSPYYVWKNFKASLHILIWLLYSLLHHLWLLVAIRFDSSFLFFANLCAPVSPCVYQLISCSHSVLVSIHRCFYNLL